MKTGFSKDGRTMRQSYEWQDLLGDTWSVNTGDKGYPPLTALTTQNLGGAVVVGMPGIVCQEMVQDELGREILRLSAEVDRLKALTEWQPMETAPKDGSPVLLAGWVGIIGAPHYRCYAVGHKYADDGWITCDGREIEFEPTHWMISQINQRRHCDSRAIRPCAGMVGVRDVARQRVRAVAHREWA
jgi:hypothetical protein